MKATIQIAKWKEKHDGHWTSHLRFGLLVKVYPESSEARSILVFSSRGELKIQEITDPSKIKIVHNGPHSNLIPMPFLRAILHCADAKRALQTFMDKFNIIRGPRD